MLANANSLYTHTDRLRAQWPAILFPLALALLYGPTYVTLASGFWPLEQYAHGPLVVGVVLWLLWKRRDAFRSTPTGGDTAVGSAILGLGLLLFVLGRSQDIINVEVASQIPVMAGALLVLYGRGAVRALAFPLLFLTFLIPLPPHLIDALTGPLKQQVSIVVDHTLYWVGYPIARSGVVLTMGPYQILIADACSGLNSIYSLSAVGLLYTYISGKKPFFHTATLVLSILPIAFLANVLRVIVLMLITYHFGNEAGQGFFHGFAGVFLFVIALSSFIGLDVLLRMVGPRRVEGTV